MRRIALFAMGTLSAMAVIAFFPDLDAAFQIAGALLGVAGIALLDVILHVSDGDDDKYA